MINFKLVNVSTGYFNGKSPALVLARNVNDQIQVATRIMLIGANGVGKSTFFKSICGLLRLVSGEIYFDSKRLDELSEREIARTISMVTTTWPSNNMLTVHEILNLGRYPYSQMLGMMRDEDHLVVKKFSKIFNLCHLMDKSFNHLSDGQRQLVMISRGFIQTTPILILDEPFIHLDIGKKVWLKTLLKRLVQEEQKIIIFSHHDFPIDHDIADRAWFLSHDGSFQVCSGDDHSLIQQNILKLFPEIITLQE